MFRHVLRFESAFLRVWSDFHGEILGRIVRGRREVTVLWFILDLDNDGSVNVDGSDVDLQTPRIRAARIIPSQRRFLERQGDVLRPVTKVHGDRDGANGRNLVDDTAIGGRFGSPEARLIKCTIRFASFRRRMPFALHVAEET
jgi:hypothetical protein